MFNVKESVDHIHKYEADVNKKKAPTKKPTRSRK